MGWMSQAPAATDRLGSDERPVGYGLPWSLSPPEELGRNLVVTDDTAVPAPWRLAPRVVIDLAAFADPSRVTATVCDLADRRDAAVIVVEESASMVFSGRRSPGGACRRSNAGPIPDLERLQWLIWSNAIDLRPGRVGWWALERAVQLGARLPTPAEEVTSVAKGDICTPDGRWCWIDAGPPRLLVLDGADVISGIALEHGSLQPSRPHRAHAELSATQRAAVEEPSGSVRVIAPAGSGKTRVLTERARHLIEAWQIPASAITMLAFNRRARDELVERTADLPGLQIRTLNSMALAIINGTAPFAPRHDQRATIGEERSRALLRDAISAVTRHAVTDETIERYREAFVRIRLQMRDPQEVAEQFSERAPSVLRVWVRYRAALERAGVVDFDGQIHLALEVLAEESTAREAAQRSCRLLLVDEFQDLTPAHMALIRLLAGPAGSIYGVGDDDQTIYGYAGARPDWLIAPERFDTAVPSMTIRRHQLDVNHRCPSPVVSAVGMLLEHNAHRVPKEIISSARSPEYITDGGLDVICSPDPVADTVATVVDAIRAGVPPASIAVLARVNALLVPVHLELAAARIAVNAPGSADFSAHRVIASIRAWWTLSTARPGALVDPADLGAILADPTQRSPGTTGRGFDTTAAGVGASTQIGRTSDLRIRDLCGHTGPVHGRLGQVGTTLRSARAAVADGATVLQWLEVIGERGEGRGESSSSLPVPEHDHLTAIRQIAARLPTLSEFGGVIDAVGDLASTEIGVVLSTIHRVKGLEWPMVVLHQADALRMPHRLADDVEEERRIFHVGLTRSVERCVIVAGADPSPFIAELGIGDP